MPAPATLRLPPAAPDHELTVIIPAYNEEARLPRTLGSLRGYLDRWGLNYRVVVADDGSRDGTAGVADEFGSRFSTVSLSQNRGKGAAVRAGMLSATADVVAFTDADLPYHLDGLRSGYDLIRHGRCHVAFGARDLAGSRQFVKRKLLRKAASSVFSQVVRLLIAGDVTDTQAGLKVFSGQACREIFSRTVIDGFAFDAEVVYLTRQLRFSYERLTVELINEESSSISVWRHTLPMLREVVRVRIRGLRGAYDFRRQPDIATLPDSSLRKAA